MSDIVMPRLSDSMEEGTVVRWLKQPGEYVRRGEPLVEIETDKATLTYESDVEGLLTHFTVAEGQTVAVGTPIAFVEPQAAPQGQPAPQQPPQAQAQAPAPLPIPTGPPPLQTPESQPPPLAPPAEPVYEQQPGEYEVFDDSGLQQPEVPVHHDVTEEFPVDDQFANSEYVQPGETEYAQSPHDIYTQDAQDLPPALETPDRVKASPIARRLAKKLGVNIATIAGSGPNGRVVKEDVEAAADAAAQAQSVPSTPTQAPAPPLPPEPEYAYEPGGSEQHEDDLFEANIADTGALPLPPEEDQILPPAVQEPAFTPPPVEQPPVQAPPPAPDPALIPNFPPPPAPAPPPQQPYPPQPAYGQYPPQPQPPAYPQQPFPGPPPFVQGMTGNFPAINPQQPPQQPYPPQAPPPAYPPQQPAPQAPPPPQPPQQAPGADTATRGQSTSVDPTSAQQTVARRMAESKATAPEFFVETEVDMTTAVAYREQLRSMVTPLPSFNDFVIKASAQALRQYPNVNAAYKDGHFEQYSDVNIGMVVSAVELLAVPTLFNVDQKGLAQIAHEAQQLSEAVRTRSIQPSQMSGGTFSISNLGMYGVDRFTAILNPPQAAILAVGAINRRAVIAEDGMSLVIRQIMNMTLTCDHRILYGAEAAEFLGAIKAWLESPQLLQV
jgi:pyruvate dehydrogenase E2 component (dihydrolipoamide acetyltransferase)